MAETVLCRTMTIRKNTAKYGMSEIYKSCVSSKPEPKATAGNTSIIKNMKEQPAGDCRTQPFLVSTLQACLLCVTTT